MFLNIASSHKKEPLEKHFSLFQGAHYHTYMSNRDSFTVSFGSGTGSFCGLKSSFSAAALGFTLVSCWSSSNSNNLGVEPVVGVSSPLFNRYSFPLCPYILIEAGIQATY